MSPFIHTLTELTGFRNQDGLSAALARTLADMPNVRSVAIYAALGDRGDVRWVTRARIDGTQSATALDEGSTDPGQLPLLAQYPARRAALNGPIVTAQNDGTYMSRFPLRYGQEAVEVLELLSTAAPDSESNAVVDAMLRIYSNLRALLNYGQRDQLTGLLNRKTFDEEFFKARSTLTLPESSKPDERRATASVLRPWVGMLDIDFFKKINDRFGHMIGDEVLLLVAQLLRSNCRPQDLVYRFGGEEFVVLLRCPGETEAKCGYERLRRSIEKFDFPQVGRVTVSIGFTEIHGADSPAAALGRADQAVYFAKEHGRNQVHSHANLVASGDVVRTEELIGEVELF